MEYLKSDFEKLAPFMDLLEPEQIEEYSPTLSKTQTKVIELCDDGQNVLVMGSGGCGKSFIIQELRRLYSKNKNVVVSALTGIAAHNVGGITLHSFFGIGTGDSPVQTLVRRTQSKQPVRQRIMAVDTLIVDEISMMSASLFEKLDVIARTIRRSTRPFGGIQLVFLGDFLQLQPVFKDSKEDTRLVYESDLFKRIFKPVVLTTNFRQQNDTLFKEILNRTRLGNNTQDDYAALEARKAKTIPQGVLTIVSSNRKAQAINDAELLKLKSPIVVYNAFFSKKGDSKVCADLQTELTKQLDTRGVLSLRLKVGARVMLIKNLDVANGLVNGSTGTVTGLATNVVSVLFDAFKNATPVQKTNWELSDCDDNTVTATQFPLMLCWSVTVHKCQSLTLQSAVLDISDAFCEGMVYVALSRLVSLDGLYLKSFDKSKVSVNKKTVQYLESVNTV